MDNGSSLDVLANASVAELNPNRQADTLPIDDESWESFFQFLEEEQRQKKPFESDSQQLWDLMVKSLADMLHTDSPEATDFLGRSEAVVSFFFLDQCKKQSELWEKLEDRVKTALPKRVQEATGIKVSKFDFDEQGSLRAEIKSNLETLAKMGVEVPSAVSDFFGAKGLRDRLGALLECLYGMREFMAISDCLKDDAMNLDDWKRKFKSMAEGTPDVRIMQPINRFKETGCYMKWPGPTPDAPVDTPGWKFSYELIPELCNTVYAKDKEPKQLTGGQCRKGIYAQATPSCVRPGTVLKKKRSFETPAEALACLVKDVAEVCAANSNLAKSVSDGSLPGFEPRAFTNLLGDGSREVCDVFKLEGDERPTQLMKEHMEYLSFVSSRPSVFTAPDAPVSVPDGYEVPKHFLTFCDHTGGKQSSHGYLRRLRKGNDGTVYFDLSPESPYRNVLKRYNELPQNDDPWCECLRTRLRAMALVLFLCDHQLLVGKTDKKRRLRMLARWMVLVLMNWEDRVRASDWWLCVEEDSDTSVSSDATIPECAEDASGGRPRKRIKVTTTKWV